MPEALTGGEIPSIIEGFVTAARNAVEAGLDGVEIHAANGYLVHQFLGKASNQRTDEYGGSPANRARLAIEILTAVAEAIGAERTGLRISPEHNIQGVVEDDQEDLAATYTALAEGWRRWAWRSWTSCTSSRPGRWCSSSARPSRRRSS